MSAPADILTNFGSLFAGIQAPVTPESADYSAPVEVVPETPSAIARIDADIQRLQQRLERKRKRADDYIGRPRGWKLQEVRLTEERLVEITAIRAAVIELVDADKEYDAAFDSGDYLRMKRAEERRAAALAGVQGGAP